MPVVVANCLKSILTSPAEAIASTMKRRVLSSAMLSGLVLALCENDAGRKTQRFDQGERKMNESELSGGSGIEDGDLVTCNSTLHC